MNTIIFSEDIQTNKELVIAEGVEITDYAKKITADVSDEAKSKGECFSEEIKERFVADFEKKGIDKMVHVSTFAQIGEVIYMTYYANCKDDKEDPDNQMARLAYCDASDTENITILNVQSVGDKLCGERVNRVYDTIFAKVDDDTLVVLWTAMVGSKYYRLYRFFDIKTKSFGEIGVNRFKVGDVVNDFSTTGIQTALAANDIQCKKMYSDIGIMQKFTEREENGVTYYYTGAYSGDFNCIIKSADYITWEYVSQPDFLNLSKWENATYVLDDKIYYVVRQQDTTNCAFFSRYDLNTKTWDKPVLIEDCQSRSDFIMYEGGLYLVHAPINREHIGIIKIDTENIADSQVVLQADMHGSCFYPFVQYLGDGELAMSYTVSRKHIRLARFDLKKYI